MRKKFIKLALSFCSMVSIIIAAPTLYAQDSIKIGVPLPLTGIMAETGQHFLTGMQFAVFEANQKGGVLGKKIEIIAEDTKGEINTAGSVAEKLITKNEVFALVGGYGSTVDFGMLQSIKSYEPLFVHAGSSTVKLEETFGNLDWYFHIYIWDYHRQAAIAKFLASLKPQIKTVAMIYEDGLFGKTSYEYAQKYLKEYGLELVLAEPFKSGSADFSGILNKAKSVKPDILYWVAYTGDNIQIARQCKTLMFNPKLKIYVGSGSVATDFGDSGDKLCVLDIWAPKMKVDGLDSWIKNFNGYKPNYNVVMASAQGYTAMSVLLQSIEKAGKLNKKEVESKLGESSFWTPFGNVKFQPTNKARHNLMNENTMIMVQYQKTGEEVVYPSNFASSKVQLTD
jgi:branched-chain amino acid transport system substrate-binding protein